MMYLSHIDDLLVFYTRFKSVCFACCAPGRGPSLLAALAPALRGGPGLAHPEGPGGSRAASEMAY